MKGKRPETGGAGQRRAKAMDMIRAQERTGNEWQEIGVGLSEPDPEEGSPPFLSINPAQIEYVVQPYSETPLCVIHMTSGRTFRVKCYHDELAENCKKEVVPLMRSGRYAE